MPDIDFKALAAAALSHAESLLAEWLPHGRRDGHEWKSVNPTRADRSAGSFSININSGAWGDFATDDSGGDLVSLNAYLFHNGNQLEAAYEVAERIGFPMPPRKTASHGRREARREDAGAAAAKEAAPERKRRSPWVPILPVPQDAAPVPVAHPIRGKPERIWCYRNALGQMLGHVCRFVTSDGGKEILPLTWCRNGKTGKHDWRWMSFPEPRPLYGLDRLFAKPDATVLVVEGEKCADVAHEQLPELAVVSWPGGGKAVDKADWSVLQGRKVIIWPDCDAQRDKHTDELLPEEKQPGWKAANRIAELLTDLDARIWLIRIPFPGEKPSGWDVADAVEEGLTGEPLAAWVREHSKPHLRVIKGDSHPMDDGAAGESEPPADNDWEYKLLHNKQGLRDCLANVHDILLNEPAWQGVVAFDEFAQRTVKLKPPPYVHGTEGAWDDNDDTQTAMWLQRRWSFTPDTLIVGKAIEALAKEHKFHPVLDWLRGLAPWDGVSRVEMWLTDYCGVVDTPYVRLVAKFFLVAMVARILKPGCKFDYCLVLEGPQGARKSTIARVLGGEWFGDTDLELGNKDSMAALAGKLVYELAEMGAVTRADAAKQKAFLSRQADEFRPVYGKRLVRLLRQCVFVGTTNEDEWNKDPTGGRRFWPVRCVGEINSDGLAAVRDLLFAEALALYEQGERFWPTQEEQRTLFNPEQSQRELQEAYIDALHDWVFEQVAVFSIADAAMTGLKLDASKLTRDVQTRIGSALKKLGCRKIEKRNGMVRYWYEPPKKEGGTDRANRVPDVDEGEHRARF